MRKILREPQVHERTGLDRVSRWRLVQAGKFPAPIHLGTRARGWMEDEVEDWIAARQKERDRRTG